MDPINGWVGAWHHYAVTYDGTTMRSYYDGVENAVYTGAVIGATNTGVLMFGADNSRQDRGFIGYLDDIVIFSSVEDVTQIMNGTHLAMIPEPGTLSVLGLFGLAMLVRRRLRLRR